MAPARSLEGGAEADIFSVIDAAPATFYKAPLTKSSIFPTQVGGLWLPERYDPAKHGNSRIILHFHGGAYVVLSPRAAAVQWGPRMLCKELSSAIAFCPEYRLSSNPNGTFPAAIQDAVTAYRFLLEDQHIDASRIVFSGDSSGGHLVISLLRYLTHNEGLLPLPTAALLHSPWLDLTEDGTTVEKSSNAKSDYLSNSLLQWGAETFIPDGMAPDSEFISPFYHPFALKVPIWTQAGTAEIFYDKIELWVDKMKQCEGNRVQLHGVKDGMHDVFAAGGDFGMKDEALAAAQSAVGFLNSIDN